VQICTKISSFRRKNVNFGWSMCQFLPDTHDWRAGEKMLWESMLILVDRRYQQVRKQCGRNDDEGYDQSVHAFGSFNF
jgi:hypothetical protein